MLLASVPVAIVLAIVDPCVNTEAVLFIVFVLTLIGTSIVPDVDAHALHVIFVPFALVASTIKP